jgi:hypothetical protein
MRERGKQAGKFRQARFLSNALSRSAGGAGVSTGTLGKCDAEYLPALTSLAAVASGMPEDSGDRKHVLHYRAYRSEKDSADSRF